MKYLAVVNKSAKSDYSVHFPDFAGCITAGETIEEAYAFAQEALTLHIESMRRDGDLMPVPSSRAEIWKGPDNLGTAVFEVEVI